MPAVPEPGAGIRGLDPGVEFRVDDHRRVVGAKRESEALERVVQTANDRKFRAADVVETVRAPIVVNPHHDSRQFVAGIDGPRDMIDLAALLEQLNERTKIEQRGVS